MSVSGNTMPGNALTVENFEKKIEKGVKNFIDQFNFLTFVVRSGVLLLGIVYPEISLQFFLERQFSHNSW